MGVGKSTVGKRLAERLGVDFVDLDARVEASTGASVAELFASRGEASFRTLERAELLCTLDAREPRVVALGGGTLVEPRLRELALERAFVVALGATVETLVQRTRGSVRPLLEPAPEVAIPRLLAVRARAYADAHVTIRTDGRTVEDLARDLEHLWQGWS
jgi:shikimate kinase